MCQCVLFHTVKLTAVLNACFIWQYFLLDTVFVHYIVCTAWTVKFVINLVWGLFLSWKWSTAPWNSCFEISIPLVLGRNFMVMSSILSHWTEFQHLIWKITNFWPLSWKNIRPISITKLKTKVNILILTYCLMNFVIFWKFLAFSWFAFLKIRLTYFQYLGTIIITK